MTSRLARADQRIRPGARVCSRDVCARVRQELGERSDCGEGGPLPPRQGIGMYVASKRTFTKRRPDTLLMGGQLFQTWAGVVQWLEASTAGTHAYKTKDGNRLPPATASRFIQSETRSAHPGCPPPSPIDGLTTGRLGTDGTSRHGERPPPTAEK